MLHFSLEKKSVTTTIAPLLPISYPNITDYRNHVC